MRITVNYGETNNNELIEKMAAIKDYEEFDELCNTYGWNEAIAAFVNTNDCFKFDWFEEAVEEHAFNLIIDYIDDAIKAKTAAEYEEDEKACCICGVGKANNNAAPYAEGYCCDVCNAALVIPARIEEIFKNRGAKQESK